MTTLAQPNIARASHIDVGKRDLSALGILRSEWIKLRSLRSTVWAFAVLVLLQVGMGTVVALTANPEPGSLTVKNITDAAINTSTIGVAFGQLVIAVLGVLVISGEYGTGQIRSSFMAVPSRLPVLWAKAFVFAITTFAVTFLGATLTYLVAIPIYSAVGADPAPLEPSLWLGIVGAAGFLSFIGVISLGLGALLRSTAAGIAASLGLLLVLPTVLQLIPLKWLHSILPWLPGNAGQQMIFSGGTFEPWQASLVMLGWAVASVVLAAVFMKRRDA